MHKAVMTGVLACAVGLSGCATNGQTSMLICALVGGATYALTKNTGAAVGACAVSAVVAFAALNQKEKEELRQASIRAAMEGRTNERIAWGGQQQIAAADQSTPVSTHSRGSKHRHHSRPKKPTVQANAAVPSGETKTAAATPNVNEATGWVVPVSDVYVANGKTLRKLHQVAVKNGKTEEHDVTAEKTATGWVIPA